MAVLLIRSLCVLGVLGVLGVLAAHGVLSVLDVPGPPTATSFSLPLPVYRRRTPDCELSKKRKTHKPSSYVAVVPQLCGQK